MRATLDSLVPRLPYRLFAGAELSARTCKSQRVRTSGENFALAKSRCRQVRHGAWKSGEPDNQDGHEPSGVRHGHTDL
jgi:hypothetical protein